jgi:hypothetical protein
MPPTPTVATTVLLDVSITETELAPEKLKSFAT